jgi:hypothetical protein
MVTSNAAEIANWQGFVGKIETGMFADLVVIDTFHENPYRNLIEAVDPDVRLTIVHGKAVFGDIDLMTAMKGDDWEYINGSGFSKAIDVTSPTETDGMQTWENIESGLSMAMRNEFDDIKNNWNDVSGMTDSEIEDWLATTFDGDYRDEVNHLKNLTLDPIFTIDDERYFDVINRSAHANFHIDMTKLYDYYDIDYEGNSDREFIDDPDYANGNDNSNPDPVTDPDPDPDSDSDNETDQDNDVNPDDESDNQDNDNGEKEIDCIGIACEDDTIIVSTESEERSPIVMLSVIMGVILIAAIVVIIFSKEKKDEEEELAEEAAIWDEKEFVPEMPPIKPPKED